MVWLQNSDQIKIWRTGSRDVVLRKCFAWNYPYLRFVRGNEDHGRAGENAELCALVLRISVHLCVLWAQSGQSSGL